MLSRLHAKLASLEREAPETKHFAKFAGSF